MFNISKNSKIPFIVLNSNFEVDFYSQTAKKEFPNLKKGVPMKKDYPSFAWITVENSLLDNRPDSIYFEQETGGASICFVPLDNGDKIAFYGVIHPLTLASLDPSLSMLMHDMKTPLSIIRNSAMLIREQADPAIVSIIERNSLKLLHLVSNVGSLLKNPLNDSAKSLVNLSELFATIEKEIVPLISSEPISIEFQIEERIVIFCAYEQIERIAINFISNSIKFCKSHILVVLRKEKDFAFFSVEDDGDGILKEDIKNVFSPWYSKSKNMPKGSGLGLSIASEFAKKNDSEILVESTAEKTVFTCKIPLSDSLNILNAPKPDYNSNKNILNAEFSDALSVRASIM